MLSTISCKHLIAMKPSKQHKRNLQKSSFQATNTLKYNSFRNATTSQLQIKIPFHQSPENRVIVPKIICLAEEKERFPTKIILIFFSVPFSSFSFCPHEKHSIMMLMSLFWLARLRCKVLKRFCMIALKNLEFNQYLPKLSMTGSDCEQENSEEFFSKNWILCWHVHRVLKKSPMPICVIRIILFCTIKWHVATWNLR